MRKLNAAFRVRTGINLWVPAAIVLTWYMLLAFDPFGIGAASKQRSEAATLRIVAPFYTPARRNTAVAVVIDDEYLRDRNTGWPLRYAEQGRILRQLLAVKPAVVLVDLVYPHGHGEDSDAVKALIDPIRNNTTTPVILTALAKGPAQLPEQYEFCPRKLAKGQPSLLDADSMQEELRALNYEHGYVGWSGCGTSYPLLLGGDIGAFTPAFAAYRRFCMDHPTLASCPRGRPATQPAKFLYPMTVRAGAFPPYNQSYAYGDACQRRIPKDADISLLRRIAASAQQLGLTLFRDPRTNPDPDIALPCPAVTVVPLSTLADAPRQDWEDLLAGNVVVLGANITGIPDLIEVPVHGQIPGVVWHAMAVDNLLSLGPDYLASRHPDAQKALGILLVFAFAYALPFIAGWLENPPLQRGLAALSLPLWVLLAAFYFLSDDHEAALIALGLGVGFDLVKPTSSAVYLIAIAAAACGSFFILQRGWPPENWLGLVMVLVAFSATIKPYYHEQARKGFPSSLSVSYRTYKLLRKQS